MSLENKIISTLFASREAFNKLQEHINKNTFSDYGQEIYNYVEEFYKVDNSATKVDKEIVVEKLQKKLGEKKYKLYHEYLEGLPEPASLPNLLNLFVGHRQERLGLEISGALAGKKEKQAKELMEQYLGLEQITGETGELLNGLPLTELEKAVSPENIIPIAPSKLNDALKHKGAPRQYQICIFGPTNGCKTTVAVNLAGVAAMNGKKVLICQNEDPQEEYLYRLICRILKKPELEIKADIQGNYELAMQSGYQNIYFKSMFPGTLEEVRGYIEKIRPDVVVIDQIRNMNIKPDSMTINLEQGVIGMRNLAKEFGFVSVVLTQAGDSANGKLYLEMNDVEWSNVGVAAQMDLMIGVGQNEDFKQQGKVMLSFPKVKYQKMIQPFHCKVDFECQRLLV